MRKLCRIIFSRYSISAIIIALDIALVAYLLYRSVTLYIGFAAIALLVDLCVVLSLINRDANPEFKISWLVVVLVLPLFGALLYILFYRRRMSRRDSRRMEEILHGLNGCGSETTAEKIRSELSVLSELDAHMSGQAYSLLGSDPLSSLFTSSSFTYYDSGEEMYQRMLLDIESAEKYIFLEYFIISEGEMWQGIHERLVSKVRAGVEVRILYDDIGCMSTLPNDYPLRLMREGIACCRFSKVTPKVTSVHNNRDHRKLMIIDGRIGFTGGVNIADEYINKKTRFGNWKDGGVRLTGEAVRGFTGLFLSLYDFSSGKKSDYSRYLDKETEADDTALFGEPREFYIPFGTGPFPIYKTQVGKRAIINALNGAQSFVYITTPYLIIDYELKEALCAAAARGVDVRIITPGIADKKIVKIMTKSSYMELIKRGVRIFEYSPGFIHEKMLVADGELAIIGTINLDFRSLVHHFECALWVYGSPEIEKIRASFMKTLKFCREITEKSARLTFPEIIIRYTVRLFAPLM